MASGIFMCVWDYGRLRRSHVTRNYRSDLARIRSGSRKTASGRVGLFCFSSVQSEVFRAGEQIDIPPQGA